MKKPIVKANQNGGNHSHRAATPRHGDEQTAMPVRPKLPQDVPGGHPYFTPGKPPMSGFQSNWNFDGKGGSKIDTKHIRTTGGGKKVY